MTKKERIQQEFALKLTSLIAEYLRETASPATVEEFANELEIAPIVKDGTLIGFWGLTFKGSRTGSVATIKAMFVEKNHRGAALNKITDDLMKSLGARGVKHIEVWAFPDTQRWMKRRYGIEPSIFVSVNPIEKFQVWDKQKKTSD